MRERTHWLRDRPFTAALVALALAIALAPSVAVRDLGVSMYTVGLCLAAFGATRRRWLRIATLVYGAAAIAIHVGQHSSDGAASTPVIFVIDLVLAAVVSVLVIRHVLSKGAVDTEELAGALVSYVLIGVFFGAVHLLIANLVPGAYSGLEASAPNPSWQFTYFSFVTLTTLGYGDVTPVAPMAQGASTIEAVLGQGYLAILIARLVAKMGDDEAAAPATTAVTTNEP